MSILRKRLVNSTCLTAAFVTLVAGFAFAGDGRDPWKNLRAHEEVANPARIASPAKSPGHATVAAANHASDKVVYRSLGVLEDRVYGAPVEERTASGAFIPGLDGFAGDKKWQPYVEFTAAPGKMRSHGQVNLFAPLMQNSNSMLFTDFRASVWTNDIQEGNFGLGYRQIVPGAFFGTDAILGLYGFLDARRSAYDNMFYQGTIGAEIITNNFEFRANGYLPSSNQYVVGTTGVGGVLLDGRDVVFGGSSKLIERALPGFDVEAGVKIDFSEAAIRLNAGYFRFERGSTLIEGPRFRAEFEIDDPFGWNGAKLSLGGEVRNDKLRGTEVSGLVRFRMPIGGANSSGQADQKLSGLDRVMTRRIYRDADIVTHVVTGSQTIGGAPVLDATTGESLQAYFVANTAQGAADCSNVANACEFNIAQSLAGPGDTFLPVDVAGAIGSVFALNNNRQQVIAGGNTGSASILLSDSANSMLVVTNLGGRPIVTEINLGHFADTRVAGLTTNSANGIIGNGMTGAIGIRDVQIMGGGLLFANSAATIDVADAALNSGAANGIALTNLTGTANFNNVDVVSAGGKSLEINGGSVRATFDANSSLTQSGVGSTVEVTNGHTGRLTSNAIISATNGSGLQFDNADGVYDFNGATTLNGGDAGIDIIGNSSGAFTFASNSHIINPTGPGLNIQDFDAGGVVNYNGSITNNLDVIYSIDTTAAGSEINFLTNGSNALLSTDNPNGAIFIFAADGNITQTTPMTVTRPGFSSLFTTAGAGVWTFNDLTISDQRGLNGGVDVFGQTGTVNFNNLNITTDSAGTGDATTGFLAGGNNVMNVTGNSNVNADGGGALVLININEINMTFGSLVSTNNLNTQIGFAGDDGIDMLNIRSGNLTVTGTTTVDRADGTGISLEGVGADVNFANVALSNIGVDGVISGVVFSNTGTTTIGGGSISNTGFNGLRFGSSLGGGASTNADINNVIFSGIGGFVVRTANSTLSGSGNTAAAFSCNDGGGNTGTIQFNAGVDSCP